MEYNGNPRAVRTESGFSLLEMLTVIGVMFILAAFAIFNINGALPGQEATAGLNSAAAVFHQGRDMAISQRRYFQLVTNPPTQIGLQRLELSGGYTALPMVTLPPPAQFGLIAGIPDTPDGFGTCSNGLCFGGSSILPSWLSDGTFVDGSGQPLNATVFVCVPGNASTQRAFTILGTTGRIRAYKWTGGNWILE